MKNRISAIIICMNEEARIRRCLESIKWLDEIVIVDSGSTDKTLSIAREYTDKIFINADWNGFGPQKRLAESKAENDWVFAIDSDEVVSEGLKEEIISITENLDEKAVYRVNRLTNFCNKFIRHSGWYPDRIVRLYNKKKYHYNDAFVHESVECKSAKKVDLEGDLFHYTADSLEDYINKRNGYAKAWALSQYKKGKRATMSKAVIRSGFAFFRHYVLRLGILDGRHGFLISVIQMEYTFNKYNFLLFKTKD